MVRLKCYRSHVVYERHLCVVPVRLKNDLLHARPVYSVRARHLSGGFGNRSRREYTVGVCMMYRCTYCIPGSTYSNVGCIIFPYRDSEIC